VKLQARSLLGKDILVGKTFYDDSGAITRQEQFHADIVGAHSGKLDLRRFDDGEPDWVPADADAIRPAPGGDYRLSSSGALVKDPALVTSWRIRNSQDAGRACLEVEPNLAPFSHSRVPEEWKLSYAPRIDRFSDVVALFGPDYLAHTLLLGISHLDAAGRVTRREQIFGTMTQVDAKRGVVLTARDDGRKFSLPPDLALIERAPAGTYRFRNGAGVIENPDYLTSFEYTE